MSKYSDTDRLLEVGLGYWHSKSFLTACRLNLFTVIEEGNNTVDQVAATLALPLRTSRILMDAMISLGFLTKEAHVYATTSLSSDYLVDTKSAYMGEFFTAIDSIFFSPFVDFAQALQEDLPVWNFDKRTGKHTPISPKQSQLLTRGLHALNRSTGMAFGRMCDLSNRKLLLDIGGGSGVMSINAVLNNPSLNAIVLDRPSTCTLAQDYIHAASLSHRVTTRESDFIRDVYSEAADVHLYSNVFQNLNLALCRQLIEKSHKRLPPAGKLLIVEYLVNEERTSPSFGAFFNLFALVATAGGEARTFHEYLTLLEEAGFCQIKVSDLYGPSSLIEAIKGD